MKSEHRLCNYVNKNKLPLPLNNDLKFQIVLSVYTSFWTCQHLLAPHPRSPPQPSDETPATGQNVPAATCQEILRELGEILTTNLTFPSVSFCHAIFQF